MQPPPGNGQVTPIVNRRPLRAAKKSRNRSTPSQAPTSIRTATSSPAAAALGYVLPFGRTYLSSSNLADIGMGKGWAHSYDLTAAVNSDPYAGMGAEFADQRRGGDSRYLCVCRIC